MKSVPLFVDHLADGIDGDADGEVGVVYLGIGQALFGALLIGDHQEQRADPHAAVSAGNEQRGGLHLRRDAAHAQPGLPLVQQLVRDGVFFGLARIRDEEGVPFIPSLMSQFTPFYKAAEHNLGRRITTYEYRKVIDEAVRLGLTDGYMQEKSSAREEYTPPFDLEGV